jgi:hypothetical protein
VIALADVERDVVIVVCGISAGIHAALTPEHLTEGLPPGLGFAASAVLLAGLAVVLTSRPASVSAFGGAAVVLSGLLVTYALATTTGLPLLHPEAEPVDGLALATKAIEAAGLLAAVHHLRRSRQALTAAHSLPKGMFT